jgi:hypothetical protein
MYNPRELVLQKWKYIHCIFKKNKGIYKAASLGYRSKGPGSFPGATRFSEK